MNFEIVYYDAAQKIHTAIPVQQGNEWSCPELGLSFSCSLDKNEFGMKAQISSNSFREEKEYRFKELVVNCSQFETEENSKHSLFIPWDSGFLCHAAKHDSNEYWLPIFNERQYIGVWGNMPLFGLSDETTFHLGLIESGQFDCDLRLRTAWGEKRQYSISPVFLLREKAGEKLLPDDLSILFIDVEGNWKQAAHWYRNYNLQKRKLRTLAERVSHDPALDYSLSALTVRCRMSVKPLPAKILEQTPETAPKPNLFLKFDDVRTIAEEFKRQQVGPSEFCLVGWNYGGHDGAFPQLFPVSSICGSEESMAKLISDVAALGYHISLHDNYMDGYRLAENLNMDDICFNGGPQLGGGRLGGGQAYQICPSKAEKYAKANFAEIKKRLPQLSGPYFVDVMSIIAMRKCDHPSHPITRRENCQYYRSILHLTQENFGLSMSEGSRDWAIDRLDRAFLIFGKTKNTLAFCDEHIPFFQMVYHGIILYNNGRCHVNAMAGSVGYLENIRWGGLPLVYFHHLFNPEWVGAAGWANDLRLDSPEKLAKDVAVIKQMSNDAQALRSTQQAFLDDYIDYNENLSETVYSNGVHVWVNRGGKAEKTSDGRSVAPYSFLIQ